MTKEITSVFRKYSRTKIQKLKPVFKDYKTAWRNLEKIGKEINQAWKIKKHSFEILREERE